MNNKYNVLLTYPEIDTVHQSLECFLEFLESQLDNPDDVQDSVAFHLYKKICFLLEEISLNDE